MSQHFSKEELQKILYSDPKELTERLRQWMKEPSTQPELEYYYRNYLSKGKAVPRSLQQWEKEAKIYIPLIKKAMALEKAGHKDEALKLYMQIINEYDARGTAYYERPAIILEKAKKYEEAIAVCMKALANPYLVKSRDEFQRRLELLTKKLQKQQQQRK